MVVNVVQFYETKLVIKFVIAGQLKYKNTTSIDIEIKKGYLKFR